MSFISELWQGLHNNRTHYTGIIVGVAVDGSCGVVKITLPAGDNRFAGFDSQTDGWNLLVEALGGTLCRCDREVEILELQTRGEHLYIGRMRI